MIAPWNRTIPYLVGGGLFLTWLEPPDGALRFFVIGGLIIAFAYLDGFLGKRAAAPGDDKVVSIRAFQAKKKARREGSVGGGSRRALSPVYSSANYGDVEALLQMLRAERLSPMMVTQNSGGAKNSFFYMVMLPEQEFERAKPIIDLYEVKSSKRPS